MSFLSQRRSFLSQSAKNKLLDEAQQHLQQHLTKDPAMPGFLRSIYSSLIRIFWKDFVQEFDSSVGDAGGEGEQQEAEMADLAAAPTIAMGMLQVLVVEARNLRPAQGIGTNPYVRGMLGHQVRRSKTAWSTLNPFWKCLMEFPVVSMKNTLDLEVMSQAPLFGGDTRLGYISVPLTDIIGQHDAQSSPASRYRRETLLGSGSSQCEVVLILDYKPLEQRKDRACFKSCCRRLRRSVAQFRAFFLYHYWPCDKSLFQMYLKEPMCICLLILALCPFLVVRACFFTILLVCLCFPFPPDEYQIMEYILACKGTAIFTDGLGRTVSGFLIYYSCIRAGTCHEGGGPGSSLGSVAVALDLYMEVLIWFACFVLLPRTVPFGSRIGTGISVTGGVPGTPDQMHSQTHAGSQVPMTGDAESGAIKGGRMKVLLKYNLICFATCMLLFGCLSARDVLTSGTEPELLDKCWRWRIPENFFWSRTIFGLLMSPFCMLLHPQTNKLLTHCTPTGYTRLGTLLRYRPSYHKLRKDKKTSPLRQTMSPSQKSDEVADHTAADGVVAEKRALSKESESGPSAAVEHHLDPIADLQAAIKRLPAGAFALGTGKLWVRVIGTAIRITGKVVSFEIRTVSYAVSLGLRTVDTGVTTSLSIASYIPGSTLALQIGGCAASWIQRLGKATLSCSAGAVRCLPGGTTSLHALQHVLQTVGFWAAAAESGEDLSLLAGSERAEHLKLEAAARLAEMLTRAEHSAQLSAREAAEWTAEAAHWCAVRPEITKIAQALKVQPPKFGSSIQRAFSACDVLGQSLWVTTRRLAIRLIAASSTLVRAFRRELKDLNEKAPDRAPGWKAAWEAYSMLFCSAVCEAFLELRPAKEGAMHRQISGGDVAAPPADRLEKDPPLMAHANGAGVDMALGSKRFQARPRKST